MNLIGDAGNRNPFSFKHYSEANLGTGSAAIARLGGRASASPLRARDMNSVSVCLGPRTQGPSL
jgi:hypothetical protein